MTSRRPPRVIQRPASLGNNLARQMAFISFILLSIVGMFKSPYYYMVGTLVWELLCYMCMCHTHTHDGNYCELSICSGSQTLLVSKGENRKVYCHFIVGIKHLSLEANRSGFKSQLSYL